MPLPQDQGIDMKTRTLKVCEWNDVNSTPQLADLHPAEIIFGDNPSWGAGSTGAPVTPRLQHQQAFSLRSASTFSAAALWKESG